MEKPNGILKTKCPGAYLFLEGNGPQHIHPAKKKQDTALRPEAESGTSRVERLNLLMNGQLPLLQILSQEPHSIH